MPIPPLTNAGYSGVFHMQSGMDRKCLLAAALATLSPNAFAARLDTTPPDNDITPLL